MWRPVGLGRWLVVLEGRVRHAIPVEVVVGTRMCTLRSFLVRGPRDPEAAAALHRVLLRKNGDLNRVRLCLDEDDDVVLVARLGLRGLTPDDLDEALGEVLTVAESSFEPLVHLAYPGVFAPLRTSVP